MLILGVFVFEEAGVAHSGAIGDHYSVSTQQTRCRRHITVALLWLDWTFAVAAAGSSAPQSRRWPPLGAEGARSASVLRPAGAT